MKKLASILVLVALAASLNGQRAKKSMPPTSGLNPLRGYVNITEIGGGPGLAVTDAPYAKYYFGLTTVNGYQINKYIIAGIGVGVQFYNEGTLAPFYVSGRFTYPIENSRISPYANGDIGILLNFKSSDGHNFSFFNPVVGARYTLKSTMALDLGIGLFSQMNSEIGRDSFLNFKFGLVFIPKR